MSLRTFLLSYLLSPGSDTATLPSGTEASYNESPPWSERVGYRGTAIESRMVTGSIPHPDYERVEITIERGKNLIDKDWFNQSDPYVIVEMAGNAPQKTTTKTDNQDNPVWYETFSFLAKDPHNDYLKLFVYDSDATGSEFLGWYRWSFMRLKAEQRKFIRKTRRIGPDTTWNAVAHLWGPYDYDGNAQHQGSIRVNFHVFRKGS